LRSCDGRDPSESRIVPKEMTMQDLIYVAITVAFFVVSIGYVHFCDRVK